LDFWWHKNKAEHSAGAGTYELEIPALTLIAGLKNIQLYHFIFILYFLKIFVAKIKKFLCFFILVLQCETTIYCFYYTKKPQYI